MGRAEVGKHPLMTQMLEGVFNQRPKSLLVHLECGPSIVIV